MANIKDLVKFGTEVPSVYEQNKPYYILRGDGVYRHTKKESMLVKEIYSKLEKSIPLLEKGEEGFEFLLPKMPMDVYLTILDYYKAVYEQDHTEASCHVFYLESDEPFVVPASFQKYEVGVLQKGHWLIYCPQQTNSSTLTSFREDQFYPYLRQHHTIMMETHSHHTMDAFWSSTDNANQKDPILYGVFGRINAEDKFLVKFVWNGVNINIEPEHVVEYPHKYMTVDSEFVTEKIDCGIYKGVFPNRQSFPQDWLTQCHKTGRRGSWGDTGDIAEFEVEQKMDFEEDSEDLPTFPTQPTSRPIQIRGTDNKEKKETPIVPINAPKAEGQDPTTPPTVKPSPTEVHEGKKSETPQEAKMRDTTKTNETNETSAKNANNQRARHRFYN